MLCPVKSTTCCSPGALSKPLKVSLDEVLGTLQEKGGFSARPGRKAVQSYSWQLDMLHEDGPEQETEIAQAVGRLA